MTSKKWILKVCLIVISIICPIFSDAGGMESGGGNAVLCRDNQGKMVSAEVYDLFEGRALYGYFPKIEAQDYKSQARLIAQKLMVASGLGFFITETERIIQEVRFLPKDAALIPIDDSGSIIKPANCDIFQSAIYLSNNRVYFDSNIWDLLNETNRAALVLHEVTYALLRIYENAKTSTRARQYVSFMFSGQELRPRINFFDGKPFEICKTNYDDPNNNKETPLTAFYTRVNEDGTWIISFDYLNGHKVIGATEILNPAPGFGYTWPIAHHGDMGGAPGGGGVGLKEALSFDVDESWKINLFYLDFDSDSNFLWIQSDSKTQETFFKCQAWNLGM